MGLKRYGGGVSAPRMPPCGGARLLCGRESCGLMGDNDKNSREMPPCWTGRACRLRKASVKLRKPGLPRSTRRWPAVGGGIVAAFRGRQPLAESVRHLLAFCDLQRQRDGRGRTAGAFGRGRAPADFRIDTARLAPREAVVGGRDVVEAIFAFDTVNGPGYGAVRLLREADGAVRAWTISTSLDFDADLRRARGGRRDIPRPRFRRPGLARAAAGLRDAMTTAIPTC